MIKSICIITFIILMNTLLYSEEINETYKFHIQPGFSFAIFKNVAAYGPSMEIGTEKDKIYLGVNFSLASINYQGDAYIGEGNFGEFDGGAGIIFRYNLLEKYKHIDISCGFTSGYWEFHINTKKAEVENPDSWDDFSNMKSDYRFYAGPALTISAGFERAKINLGYDFLIGNAVINVFSLGLDITIFKIRSY